MADFVLQWTPNINSNVSAQRVYYRRKSTGGSFITTGFVPDNDLPTSAVTASISGLLDNVVYEFRVANICTQGGPTFSSANAEDIKFSCNNAITATVNGTTSITITKVIHPATEDINIIKITQEGAGTQTIDPTVDGNNSATFTGLTPNTLYTFHVKYGALVNGVEVYDTANTCSITATTQAVLTCPAPTNLIIS